MVAREPRFVVVGAVRPATRSLRATRWHRRSCRAFGTSPRARAPFRRTPERKRAKRAIRATQCRPRCLPPPKTRRFAGCLDPSRGHSRGSRHPDLAYVGQSGGASEVMETQIVPPSVPPRSDVCSRPDRPSRASGSPSHHAPVVEELGILGTHEGSCRRGYRRCGTGCFRVGERRERRRSDE